MMDRGRSVSSSQQYPHSVSPSSSHQCDVHGCDPNQYPSVDDALEHMRSHQRMLDQYGRDCSNSRRQQSPRTLSPSTVATVPPQQQQQNGQQQRNGSGSQAGHGAPGSAVTTPRWSVARPETFQRSASAADDANNGHLTRSTLEEIENLKSALAETRNLLRKERSEHDQTKKEMRFLRTQMYNFAVGQRSRCEQTESWCSQYFSSNSLTSDELAKLKDIMNTSNTRGDNGTSGNNYAPRWDELAEIGPALLSESDLAKINNVILHRDIFGAHAAAKEEDDLGIIHAPQAVIVRSEDI